MTAADQDRAAFTAAICADPADDLPRLVFADWLDEQGEPERAEFVRAQCEDATLDGHDHGRDQRHAGHCETCTRRGVVANRERELWDRHGAEWLVPFPGESQRLLPESGTGTFGEVLGAGHVDGIGRIGQQFARGFLDALTLSAADWLAHADKLAWRPGLTDPCPACGGASQNWQRHVYCPGCGKAMRGAVPRPCPPTACPLTAVTLTTAPDWYAADGAYVLHCGRHPNVVDPRRHCQTATARNTPATGDNRQNVADILAAEWKGITFTLPPA